MRKPDTRIPCVADSQDDGNGAEFVLTIDTDTVQPTMGQNTTFEMILQRIGNGTEYPAVIEFSLDVERNVTWAYNYIRSNQEYQSLVRGPSDDEDYEVYMMYGSEDSSTLVTPGIDELVRDRKRDNERRNGCYSFDYMESSGREGVATHSFWDETPKDTYHFTLDVPL